MPTSATQPETTPDAPLLLAWRSPLAIAVFAFVMVFTLTADLLVKTESFKRVAGMPLALAVDEQGQPEVSVWLDEEQNWYAVEPRTPEYPASAIPAHDPVVVIPGVLNLQLTINTGAVFGLGDGYRWVFMVVSLFAIGLIGFLFARSPASHWASHLALALILAGALGNLYDRARFAAVRDMFHMLPETGLWPWIFNVADVALVLGVAAVVVMSWFSGPAPAKAEKPAES